MTQFNTIQFINELSKIGTRQLDGETQAANLIRNTLNKYDIKYFEEVYQVDIPNFLEARLTADEESIEVLPTGLVSGSISKDDKLLSSLISSQLNSDDPNLNYSSACLAISRNNFYFAPALAFHSNNLEKIKNASEISGYIKVEKKNHESTNFLIGNLDNPKTILFCHYDSIGPGAIDNASGTALLLRLAIEQPEILEDNLLIIAGNEELSYDYPVYWGHGYRVFESNHQELLQQARQILVVDCVGHNKPITTDDPEIIKLGFPLTNINYISNKVRMLYADLEQLMTVYHSAADTPMNIKEPYLEEAYQSIITTTKESQ